MLVVDVLNGNDGVSNIPHSRSKSAYYNMSLLIKTPCGDAVSS